MSSGFITKTFRENKYSINVRQIAIDGTWVTQVLTKTNVPHKSKRDKCTSLINYVDFP